MYRHLIPALAAFALTLIMPQLTKAEESLAPATVIVYRADESIRTDRLRFDLQADEEVIGRMKPESALQFEAAPGTYTLTTSIPGEASLVIDLKPGAVHYVHSKLVLKGGSLDLKLTEVAEQVAISQGANRMAGAI